MRPLLATFMALALCTAIGCATAVDTSRPDGSAGPRVDASDAPAPGATVDDAATADGATDAAPDAARPAPLPPARPVGVSIPDLFWAYDGEAAPGVGPDAARAALDGAHAAGITHVRVLASLYWPSQMDGPHGWRSHPDVYWAAFAAMAADARARGIHLVPVLLLNPYLFADMAHEHLGQLMTPGTASRALAERYVTEVVTHLRGDDTVLAWEVAGELNLLADLDVSTCTVCGTGGASNACGALAPSLGTPCARTREDNVFSCDACRGVHGAQQDVGAFMASMAALIHGLDPGRPVTSGNSYPRPSAWHLAASPCPACDWTADSPEQYAQALAQINPPGIDWISVHHYAGPDLARFGSHDQSGVELLNRTASIARSTGRTLYVGEFGERRAGSMVCGGQSEACDGDPARAATRATLDALVSAQVPWASLWGWDFHQFCSDVPTCYSVDDTDPLVDALRAHERAAAGACGGASDGAPCPVGTCTGGRCAPSAVFEATFDAPGSEGAWLTWTNCSGCREGTFARVADATAGAYARLAANDLPCGAGCAYPGAYALGAAVPASAGHALVRFTARASSAGAATVRLLAEDASGTALDASATAVVAAGDAFAPRGIVATLPPGTARLRVRLEVTAPGATLDLAHVAVTLSP